MRRDDIICLRNFLSEVDKMDLELIETHKTPENSPRVSVVIALFNGKKYIENAIESVLNQTLDDFELLIIDDCSNDDSLEFVKNRFNDSRIRLFKHEQNLGCAEVINDAIRIARGKYLQILAQDDALISKALEILVDEAEKSQADVLHSTKYLNALDPEFKIKDGLSAKITSEFNPILGLQPIDFRQRVNGIGGGTFYPEWLNFCRIEFLRDKKIFIPDVRLALDVFFLIELMLLTERFVKSDIPVHVYRSLSTNSITNSSVESHFKTFLRDLPPMFEFMQSLFRREDALTKISETEQIDLTFRLITGIFKFSIQTVDPKFLTSDAAEKILIETLSQPKFYSNEFVRNFIKIFCRLLSR